MSLIKSQAYIDGEWVDAVSKATFVVKYNEDYEIVGTVPDMEAVDVVKAIAAANQAFKTWGATTGKDRSILLKKWYDLIKENAEELVEILRSEIYKSRWEAKKEFNIALENVEFFAEEAKKVDDWIPNEVYVKRQPLGVVDFIIPSDFPPALSVKKMATALAAGCTCVLKAPLYKPWAVLAVVELAHQVGFPKGVINVITSGRANASDVDRVLCSSPLIAGISFTGRTEGSKILHDRCAPHIKRVPLELGENIPFLVFNSANIDKAVEYGMKSTFLNCGEIYAACYVFLVQEDVHDQFVEKFSEAMKEIKADVTIGPHLYKTQFQRLCSMVDDARSKRANMLVGGSPDTKSGELFYEPTLITDVKKDVQIFRDEFYGPAAYVMKFKTEEEGVALANDTEKGLAVYLFTEDFGQIHKIRKLLQAPKIKINDVLINSKDNVSFLTTEYCIGKGDAFYGVDEYSRFSR